MANKDCGFKKLSKKLMSIFFLLKKIILRDDCIQLSKIVCSNVIMHCNRIDTIS